MAVQLQYAQPLFIEERRVGTWWRVIFISLAAFWAFAGVTFFLTARWQRTVPRYDLFALIAGIQLVLIGLLGFFRSVVIVEPAAMQLRLTVLGFTLWKRTLALDAIQSVSFETSLLSRSILKFQPKLVSFMTSKTNVLITPRKGSRLMVGSLRAEELLEILKNAIKPTDSPPPPARP